MNKSNISYLNSKKMPFWKLYRFIFVIFSLYLLGDVFYRWDGFSFHSTFRDFIPSVALVSILWSIVALIVSIGTYLSFRTLKFISHRIEKKFKADYAVLFLIIYVLLLATNWFSTKYGILKSIKLSFKQTIVSCLDWISHYAPTSKFLQGVASELIIWGAITLFICVMIWFILRTTKRFCQHLGWNIRIKQGLLILSVFVLSAAAIWLSRKLSILSHEHGHIISSKDIVFFCLALFLTWEFRDSAEKWKLHDIAQDRITPLVWLFGIFTIFSVILVTYYTLFKSTVNVVPKDMTKSSVAERKRPNIFLVTFDSLTSRNMSVYGYKRPTTPFIDEWAKEATLFTRHEAESNWTVPTVASLMTGKRGWTHRTAHLRGIPPINSDTESLPLLLRENGYYNIAVVSNKLATPEILGIANSYDNSISFAVFTTHIVDDLLYRLFANKIKLYDWIVLEDFILGRLRNMIFPDTVVPIVPPGKPFNILFDVLDNSTPPPFFVWIHILPPHLPYLPSDPYMGMFDPSEDMKASKSQWEVFNKFPKFRQKNEKFSAEIQPSIDVLRSRYDEFIRECDKAFENFIKELTERNLNDNSIVILSADHGESFEHDVLGHGGPHLYEQLTHIPLIIKEPLQKKGKIIDELVEQVDITASILDFAGIPVPSWMEGRSFVPVLRGEKLKNKTAFAMNLERNPLNKKRINKGTIGIWEGDYKLIHYLEEEKSLLFNLKNDPDERENLFDKEPEKPETGNQLLDLIKVNLEMINNKYDESN